ncbi:MAG: hypothetical protein KDE54_09160 [Caldilineaceae bacterium]|nr:hypothetical protein [Caldilineaceae bacterium]MCB0142738.1 hypothetical protein [Caldilineaceae bacterium]
MSENIVTESMETQGGPVIMPSPEEKAQPVLTTQPVMAEDAADMSARKLRDDGVTLIAGYHFFWGILLLLGTCLLAIPTLITGIVGFVDDPDALIATGILFAIGSIVMVLCLLYLVVGYGLWTLRRWGRTAAIALGVISLVNVPIGTLVGGATIWYLLKENVAQQFE